MLPGETIRSGADPMCECGTRFENEVLESAAGFYIGTTCHNSCCSHIGEPYSRESGYYPTREAAAEALANGTVNWRR